MPQSEEARIALRRRQSLLASWLAESGVFACVVDDFENQRTSMLRWLSGHPADALLFIFATAMGRPIRDTELPGYAFVWFLLGFFLSLAHVTWARTELSTRFRQLANGDPHP